MKQSKFESTAAPHRCGGLASSIFVRIGTWFEASATGWGILALPLIVLLVLGVGLLQRFLSG